MPNWCLNSVVFSGTPDKIKLVLNLFQEMQQKEIKEKSGQLPDFVEHDEYNSKFIFGIEMDQEVEGVFFDEAASIRFDTKWSPIVPTIVQIADHFMVGFEYDYQEVGHQVYGKAVYSNKVLTEINLDHSDFEQFTYNEKSGDYTFNGVQFDSESEILEMLLEKKRLKNRSMTKGALMEMCFTKEQLRKIDPSLPIDLPVYHSEDSHYHVMDYNNSVFGILIDMRGLPQFKENKDL
ncbi:MAG: hypothetical protein ABJH04_07995 [Cyclobacteriaceae bacterium]